MMLGVGIGGLYGGWWVRIGRRRSGEALGLFDRPLIDMAAMLPQPAVSE